MMAFPKTRLLQKDVKFEWTDNCQQSFDRLKTLLTEAPVLVQPESGKEFVIYSDILEWFRLHFDVRRQSNSLCF